MRSIFFLFIFGVLGSYLSAQNEAHFTHFAFNRLPFNPGFTGSDDALKVSALYRHQWEGVVGAPRSTFVSVQTPFAGERSGLGATLLSEEIGFTRQTNVALNYSYNLQLNANLSLRMGVSGALMMNNIDWAMSDPVNANDQRLTGAVENTSSPNFGAGVVLDGQGFFAGVSMPRLLDPPLYDDVVGSFADQDKFFRPLYMMAGFDQPLGDNVRLQPTLLVSYYENAPLDIDLNAMFFFHDKLGLGASYRLDDSIDFLLQFKVAQRLMIGASYDYTVSNLSDYSSGSFEVMASYLFISEKSEILNFRYF